MPVSDTIKWVDGGCWSSTPSTATQLVAVQTPQAFEAALLRRAHASGPRRPTTPTLVEALGASVRVVPGDARNVKITTPADLRAAEQLLGG